MIDTIQQLNSEIETEEFIQVWKRYDDFRKKAENAINISEEDICSREDRYAGMTLEKRPGSEGIGIGMIAYDALWRAGAHWEELVWGAMIHGGDGDSTGSVAACLWGLVYGFKSVPRVNWEELEFKERLEELGEKLWQISSRSSH